MEVLVNGKEQEVKNRKIGKKDIKVSLFRDDMIVYLKKNLTGNFLELINTFNKISVCEGNIQK